MDIGAGTGDVSLMLSELVGSSGEVVAVDNNSDILDAARKRIHQQDIQNIEFVHADLRELEGESDFDAVVGRFVLLYVGNPFIFIEKAAQHVKPGGIVAFQEYDLLGGGVSMPQSPLQARLREQFLATMEAARMEPYMGYKLRSSMVSAGLPEPRLQFDALIGGGPNWAGYEYVAELIRSVLPFMEQMGIATQEEIQIDTLSQRFRDEIVELDSVANVATCIGAFSRKQ